MSALKQKEWRYADVCGWQMVQAHADGMWVPIADCGHIDEPNHGIDREAVARMSAAAPDLLAALIEERRLRILGQQPDVHWESLRDERRACYAATDAAIARATGGAA